MSNLLLEVRGVPEPELLLTSPIDRGLYTEDQLQEMEFYKVSLHIPVYLDFQNSKFDTYSWNITGPDGYSQISPQKSEFSFVFKFTIPGKYKATLSASYTDPLDPSNSWSEQVTIRFLAQTKQTYPYKMPDMSFMFDLLPSVYKLVDNMKMISTIWSSAASLVARELLYSIEIDQSKSIKTFPDLYQKKWVEFNPELSLEDLEFKNFLFIKPISDPFIVVPEETTVISPSDFGLFSQITKKETYLLTKKDYNSFYIDSVPPALEGSVLKVLSGPATGFTFKVESILGNTLKVSPKLPSTIKDGDVVPTSPSRQVGSKGIIINLIENTTGDEYIRSIIDVQRSDEKLVIDSSIPAGTYTAEVHSTLHSFTSLEDLGVSSGDRLVIQVNRGDFYSASIPVEVYKVRGSVISLRAELESTLSFSDISIYLFLKNLGYSGAYLNEEGALYFTENYELNPDGNLVPVPSSAEVFYELLKYPPEAIGFEVFITTVLNIGTVFSGTVLPKYLIRNSKIPKPDTLLSCNELRNFIVGGVEYLEDGFIKGVTSEGTVFLKSNKNSTYYEGDSYSLEEQFIVFKGFSYSQSLPRKLWCPLTTYSNHVSLENNFSVAAGLSYSEFLALGTTLTYKQTIQGLIFAFCEGATLQSIEIGLHLLLDIPIVTTASVVEVIAEPLNDEFLYEILDIESLQSRYIYLPRREFISPEFSPIGINRLTEDEIQVGDTIPAYTALSQFIKVADNIGLSTHPNQIHKWQALVDISVVDSTLIPKTKKFLDEIKPAYTYVDFIFILFLVDYVALTDANVNHNLYYYFLDTIGPYQSERSVDSWAHSAVLRRFDSASFNLRTLFYGRDLVVEAANYVIPNQGAAGGLTEFNPWRPTDTHYYNPIFHPANSSGNPVRVGSADSVQAGDILVLTTGINEGLYEITSTTTERWFIAALPGESSHTPVADSELVEFYVVRLDQNSTSDSDDEWEEVSPLDVPSIDLDFGSNVINGSSGTLTHAALASGQTFEVLNVRSGDIIIIDSVEHEILSVSGNTITIADQSTFTNKQYVIRRFL